MHRALNHAARTDGLYRWSAKNLKPARHMRHKFCRKVRTQMAADTWGKAETVDRLFSTQRLKLLILHRRMASLGGPAFHGATSWCCSALADSAIVWIVVTHNSITVVYGVPTGCLWVSYGLGKTGFLGPDGLFMGSYGFFMGFLWVISGFLRVRARNPRNYHCDPYIKSI